MAERILLLEDEKSLSDVISLNLEIEGYEVIVTDKGKEALKISKNQHFDLIILDIMLPDISGMTVCEQIRLDNLKVPMIILSAKDTSHDRIEGLKKGADDYLTKPFNFEELLLRIQKLIKRSASGSVSTVDYFEFGNNKVNLISYQATGNDGEFVLTKKEAKLLKLFIERKDEVVSRQEILQAVWGYDVYPSTRTIDNFIMSLRRYFEEEPRSPKHFHSIRGIGYKFNA